MPMNRQTQGPITCAAMTPTCPWLLMVYQDAKLPSEVAIKWLSGPYNSYFLVAE